MRTRPVIIVLAALLGVGAPALAASTFGRVASPAAVVDDATVRLSSSDRNGAAAPMDAYLTSLLATADADTLLEVMVHGDGVDEAVSAITTADLPVLGILDRVGVALTLATPAGIDDLAHAAGVAYLEGNPAITFDLDSSHVATRGAEARTAFLPQDVGDPELPGFCKEKADKPGKAKAPKADKQVICDQLRADAHAEVPPSFADEIDGSGIGIAIVDTGIDGTHPFFQRPDGTSKVRRNMRVVRAAVPCLVYYTDHQADAPCLDGDSTTVTDPDSREIVDVPTNQSEIPGVGGHGTHVAGISAGADIAVESLGTTLHGAAPDADLYGFAMGNGVGIYDANVALEWILENHAAPCGTEVAATECAPIRVINNSYGSAVVGAEYDENSATAKIQDALVAEGVVMVWAAGNGDTLNDGGDGSDIRTNAPGQSPTPGIVMVANYDDQGEGTRDGALASSSSRGSSANKKTWPDVAAPGTRITSSCAIHLDCGAHADDADWGTISGTSMAAPHVAGIVAQLLEVDPTLTPGQVEDILEDTAYPFTAGASYALDVPTRNDGLSSFDKGHGLVDVKGAVARMLGITLDVQVPPECQTNPVALDSEGDSENGITGNSSGSTDLLEAYIVEDAGDLVVGISLADLVAEYPEGVTGEYWDLGFAIGDTDLMVVASRAQADGVPPALDVESFELARTRTTIETLATGLAGSLDLEADLITIRVAQDDLDRANASIEAANAEPGATVEPLLPTLADLPLLSNLVLTARESTYLVAGSLLSTVDSGAGICAYQVGTGVVPPPAPDPGGGGTGGGGGGGGTTEPPEEGTYDEALGFGETLTWSGSAAVPVYPVAGTSNCVGVDVLITSIGWSSQPGCDVLRVWVSSSGTLTFSAAFDANDDWDFWLFDENGAEVTSSATGDNPEEFSADVTPGVYTFGAMAFAAPSNSFDAVLALG